MQAGTRLDQGVHGKGQRTVTRCRSCGAEIIRPWRDGVELPWRHAAEPMDHVAVPRRDSSRLPAILTSIEGATFVRCDTCSGSLMAPSGPAAHLVHREDGSHTVTFELGADQP